MTFNQVSDPLYPICRPFSQSKICVSTFTNLHKSSSKLNSYTSLGPSPERPLSNPMLAIVTMHERAVKLSEGVNMPNRCAWCGPTNLTADTPKF